MTSVPSLFPQISREIKKNSSRVDASAFRNVLALMQSCKYVRKI